MKFKKQDRCKSLCICHGCKYVGERSQDQVNLPQFK